MDNIVKKPWGTFTNLLDEDYTKVKKIVIKPGESPSYQYHLKRTEIWVIVQGKAQVKLDGIVKNYNVGDIIFVGIEQKHQPKNIGKEDLIFIEIQLGEYFGEDDIKRIDDKYGRANS